MSDSALQHGKPNLFRRITESRPFEPIIIGVILLSGIVVGIETSPGLLAAWAGPLHVLDKLILAVFVVEAVLKLGALWPRPWQYFRDGWNLFDFTVVVLSLVPAAGQFALAARLLRVLRVLRLLSAVPQLRLIVTTLVKSVPRMGNVVVLLALIFYIYAVIGIHLFRDADPERWPNIGTALLTLFQVVTLEGWTDVMAQASTRHPWAWVYFLSFVIIGTFVAMNLFIAVILDSLEESRAAIIGKDAAEGTAVQAAAELDADLQILQQDLRHARQALERLEQRLGRTGSSPPGG
jgi:voltage-gated sodium channel